MNALKTLLLTLFLIACLVTEHAVAQWEWRNPDPEANEFFDAAVVSTSDIWLVGENGSIIHSSDLGTTWESVANPLRGTPIVLLSVIFTDTQTAMVSAANGNVMRTYDAGQTWELLPTTENNIQRMKMAPDGSVWGYGSNGSIARTTDQGTTWDVFSTGVSTIVYDIAFPDAQTAMAACGEGNMLTSVDGGTTWTQSVPNANTDLVSIEFTGAQVGYMLQSSRWLLRTDNGGASWSDTTLSVGEMRQVRFFNQDVGWIISNSLGNVYKTIDGGMSWNIVTVDPTTQYSFERCYPLSETTVIMTGIGGGIFITTDGGASWTQAGTAITRKDMHGVTGLSEHEAWVFGDESAYHTTTGGITWEPNAAPADPSFRTGYAITAMKLIGGGTQGQIFLTTNSGTAWSLVETLSGVGAIQEFDFVDENYGWCVGLHGTIGRTTDGGATWQNLDVGVTYDFYGISARSATEAWIAGDGGHIYMTSDGGQNWHAQTSGTLVNLRSIRFVTATEAWAGGEYLLLHSTDGGVTWARLTTTGIDVVYGIHFTSAERGYFLGSRSILRTKDGGATFYRTDYPASHLTALSPLENGYAWLVGEYGAVLRYTPAPVIRVVPSSIDYGDVATNRNSIKSFEVQSVGEVALDITNFTVQGAGFYLESGAQGVLQPDSSTTVSVRFEPSVTGGHYGLASVISNAVMGFSVVDLVGNGVQPPEPAFSHSPDTLDFGDVRLCDLLEQYVYIENVSEKNILIDSVAFFGGDSTMFLVSLPPSGFSFPGKKDSIGVLFVPKDMGALSSTLIITSNDAGEPRYEIPVKGFGLNPVATPDVDTLNFGYAYDQTTPSETITITNTGNVELIINSVEIRGTDSLIFRIAQYPTSPVPVNGTAQIIIEFLADIPVGSREAYVRISTDDCLTPDLDIPILGKVTDTAVEPGTVLASSPSLLQNYPNPFSASLHGATTLTMTLPVRADVTVTVYNALGQKMRTLSSGIFEVGSHELTLGAAGLLPGTYLVEMCATSNGMTRTQSVRVILTK